MKGSQKKNELQGSMIILVEMTIYEEIREINIGKVLHETMIVGEMVIIHETNKFYVIFFVVLISKIPYYI